MIKEKLFWLTNQDVIDTFAGWYIVGMAFAIGFLSGNVLLVTIFALLPFIGVVFAIVFLRPDFKKKSDILSIKDIDDHVVNVNFKRKTPGLDEDFDGNGPIFNDKEAFIAILESLLPEGKYFDLTFEVKKLKEKIHLPRLEIDDIN
jgi:hypothetical protein